MKEFFGILSFVLVIGVTVPYAIDILKGRAKPARSTRILFFLLMFATLLVQSRAFTSWVLALTVAELLSQTTLLILSIKHGLGGINKLDLWSYGLFIVAISGYIVTGDTLFGLALLSISDFVAFVPTLVKNWRDPSTDTPLFYFIGAIAPVFAILAASSYTDLNQLLIPVYLVAINTLALIPLIIKKNGKVKT